MIASVAMLAVAGRSRAMRHSSSMAIAMIATCNPEIESMWTMPATAKRSRTAGSTARSSAMRSARTSGASPRKSVSMRAADRRAGDEQHIARAVGHDARVRDLEAARGDEHRARDRHAIAGRRAPALDGHRGGHRAPGPAHLRAHVRAGRGGILESRAPLRACGASARQRASCAVSYIAMHAPAMKSAPSAA